MAILKLALLLSATLCGYSSAQGDMCGMPAPDPMKTCVSIRLPWNPQPMYFCTDKANFRYRNQCNNRFQTQCAADNVRQDTLMVASPWDCCPLVSYPDSCMNQHCPPPPLNRNCKTMEPNPNQPWECCSSYFCEENITPETCHFKRLEPSCNMPPQGKMNCVAFVDPYGCCPKFQCDGEARPGHCPAEVEAVRFMARMNSTNAMFGPGFPPLGPPPYAMGHGNVAVSGAGASAGAAAGPEVASVEAAPAAPAGRQHIFGGSPFINRVAAGGFVTGAGLATNQIACIGDSNCPGTMKCCTHDMNVYIHDTRFVYQNRNPVYGYCMEPVMNAVATTKSVNIA